MKLFYSIIISLLSIAGYSQTILHQTESTTRTVQDPQTVIMAPGFRATSGISNPFVAKIGPGTENPGGGPADSQAGANNPSGTSSPQGMSFHDTKGNIDVSGAGQLQFTLPIALPPGVKSVMPQINLVYSSGSSNGIAGYGWNISGISSISRGGKNIEKDGELRGIQLDYSDFYNFNGQRLVLKSGEYGKDGAEYVTEKYSNTKIRSVGAITGQLWSGPEYWEVTYPDGSQAWYGSTNTGNNSALTPTEYNMVKWKDGQGNYITYNYVQATGSNVSIISSIKWGGNEKLGKAHFNEIIFNYNGTNTRSLVEQSFINGVSFIQDNLLNNIVVNTNNSQFKKYVINYKTDNTTYQFVEKIQVYNSENQPANPVEFTQNEGYAAINSYVVDTPWSNFINLVLSGNFSGNKHSLDFIIYQDAAGSRPAGYFMKSGKEYYLGSADVFKGAVPITIKDGTNTVVSRQGFVSHSINPANNDLIISYYLIDLSKPTVYAQPASIYPNALQLIATKVISGSQWDESESIFDPFFSTYKITTIKKLIPYDIEADGVPEVLIEKNNNITSTVCALPEDECEISIYDESKYFIIKQQDNSFPFFQFGLAKSENLIFGDFNGDGISDIGRSSHPTTNIINGESVPENILWAYNLKKDVQGSFSLSEVFSANYSGVTSSAQIGDFNGDGLSDIFAATNVNGHYIINLSTGKNFHKTPYFNHFNSTESYSNPQNGNHSIVKVLDINADGKSDIVNFSSNYNIASSTSASTTTTIKVSENHGYSNGSIQFVSNTTYQNTIGIPVIYREIVGLSQNGFYFYTPPRGTIANGYLYTYVHYSNLQRAAPMNKIIQGGVTTRISYNTSSNYDYFYKPIKTEQYPLLELNTVNSQLVTRLYESANQVSRFKDFRYRGVIINLQNSKTVGFRQMASSTWFFTGLENTKVWSGVETDPLNDGAPIKEWTIRTNDESDVFPINISENNTQLLSFKSTLYQTDKILNGQLVTSPVTDANKPHVVTAMIPKSTKTKDFLTGTSTINEITYGDYYLPVQSTTNVNNGFAFNTSTLEYTHNPSGTGANYFIGRPKSKTDVSSVYSDTKSAKEEYAYENNQLKTLKIWNRDNTGYLLETYDYNDFGILAQKVISNSIDSQTQTTKTEYDPKGRFVLKKIDNLGLETHFTYNDWGQIRTQTDPLGNILTNTYDSWGKLLTSKTNLGGTTTYEYVRDSNSNIIAIQNYPDGNISKKYTNVLGQEYKASTKAFGQGQFISTETQYDVLGRKLRDSEPYFEGQSPAQWNVTNYNDTVYPPIVTSTSLAKLNASGEIISFSGKKIVTTISGLTTTVKEENGYARTTSKMSDALGNVISSLDKGGTITFSYNAASEQIKAQYTENIVTTKYDAWGRKSEFNDPSNGTYKYEYNGLGQPKKITSPKGTKEYAYNNLGQLNTQKELSAGDNGEATNKMITYSYDNKGRVISKSGTSKGKAYSSSTSYDPQGRVLSSSESSNGKYFIQKGITYDDKARVISYEKQLYSSGTLTKVKIENVYRSWNGELYQVKDSNSGKILWELKETDDRGQVLKANLGETEIKNLYDGNGFLTSVNHSSIIKPDILQLIYSFDGVKNELRTRTTGGDFSISETFDYDDNNRLINWTDPVTGIKPSSNRNVYDVKGRITQNDNVGTIKFENSAKIYQSTGMILNSEGTQHYSNDLIQTIVYNENNDPVFINGEKGDVAFQYGLTPMRQMVTYGGNFSTDGEGKFTKFYSENGSFEVVKDNITGNEKHVLYIGGSPYDSNIIFLKNFDESNASYKFLHKDYLGSILAITDNLGNKLEQRHFDAWGNLTHLKIGNGATSIDRNIINNTLLLLDRGYTSHENFIEVGIIHMNGRLYDPTLRRFLNADENIQDPHNTQNYNKYGYVMNNPMMYNDPTGEFWAWLIGAVVGSYVSGVQANNGNMNPVKWDWKQTWTSVVGGGIAGAAIGGGIQNISTNGTKFIQNSVVGAVGSIFNGLGNGQNIFKSALIGFAGINYSFDISGNNKTSTDIGDYPYGGYPTNSDGYGFASYSENSNSISGYSLLTKAKFASFYPNATENTIGYIFEDMVLSMCTTNGLTLFSVPPNSGLTRNPDGFTLTSGIDVETTIPGGVKTRAQIMKPTIIEATLTHKSNVFNKGGGQLYDYADWLSSRGGGNIFLFTSSNVTDVRELIRYGDKNNVNMFHLVPMYKVNKNNVSINFIQRRYIISLFGDFTADNNSFLFDKNFNIPR